jgi:hypothetical protein
LPTGLFTTPGNFGGGGAGTDTTEVEQSNGANGAVRIVWGNNPKLFPTTNVGATL